MTEKYINSQRIMGLDASTTTIGISVIEHNQGQNLNLIYLDHFKPSKKSELFVQLASVRDFIIEKIEEFKPEETALEDIILHMSGHSTAKTITSLAILNRTLGLAAYNALKKAPYLLNVLKIRHALKLNKILPKKEDMPELISQILGIEFPYVMKKSKKLGLIYAPESYDRADAAAVALAHLKLTYQPKKNKK